MRATPHDIASIDLERVLVRLDHKLFADSENIKLRHSGYERIKTSANIEYARTLLLRLEHDTSLLKLQSRKTAAQTTLSEQRIRIKRLTERMHEIEQYGDDNDHLLRQTGVDTTPQEDILAEYDDEGATDGDMASMPSSDAIVQDKSPSIAGPTSELRNRFLPTAPASSPKTQTSTAEMLQANDTDAVDLTGSLLSLAQALKASSSQFSDSLAADDAALKRAAEGLDKNETGLEAAGKRMGLLRKMSEGKGLWGRMMLYAWIGGLWAVAILLVFVGPKFRF